MSKFYVDATIFFVVFCLSLLSVRYVYRRLLFGSLQVMEGFPLDARRFFWLGCLLFFALFVFSSFSSWAGEIAESRSFAEFKKSFTVYTHDDWVVFQKILSRSASLIALIGIFALLPADLLSIVRGKPFSWKLLKRGIYVGIMIFPIVTLLEMVTMLYKQRVLFGEYYWQDVLLELYTVRLKNWLFFSYIGCIVVITPYVEELFFRGILQGFFGGLMHPALVVALTALIFASSHCTQCGIGNYFEIFVGAFCFSIFASLLRLKENSVMAPVGMHAMHNALSVAGFLSYSYGVV